MPCFAWVTGSALCPESSGTNALSCCGARCCTNTIATPGLLGRLCKSAENDSSPPADAPTPTIVIAASLGSSIGGVAKSRRSGDCGRRGAALVGDFLLAGMRALYVSPSALCGESFECAACRRSHDDECDPECVSERFLR